MAARKVADYSRKEGLSKIQTLEDSVVFDGTKWKEVKNLGWLIKHWKEVEQFDVTPSHSARSHMDATLVAFLRNGNVYATPFASRTLLAHWLQRPVFMGVPIVWYGHATKVGKTLVDIDRDLHRRHRCCP